MPRGGIGREDRPGEDIAIGQDDPLAGSLPSEPTKRLCVRVMISVIRPLIISLPSRNPRLMMRANAIASDSAAVFALADVQVLVTGGIAGDDEAKAALLFWRKTPMISSLRP